MSSGWSQVARGLVVPCGSRTASVVNRFTRKRLTFNGKRLTGLKRLTINVERLRVKGAINDKSNFFKCFVFYNR